MEIALLKEISIVFGLSIFVLLACHSIRIPILVGLIVTGAICGPHGLSLIHTPEEVEVLAKIGLILLLFSVGMEFSRKDIVSIEKFFFVGGTLQMGLTTFFGFCAAQFLQRPISESIFLGCILSLSSTAIVLKLLSDRGEENSPHGKIALAILVFQDLLSIPLVMVIPLFGSGSAFSDYTLIFQLAKGFAIVGAVYLIASKMMPTLFYYVARTHSREMLILAVLAICFITTWIAVEIQLPLAFGAFIAGLIFSDTDYRDAAKEIIIPFKDTFTSFFFVSLGMLVDISFVVHNFTIIAFLTFGVIFMKMMIASFTTFALGMSLHTVILTGFALAQVGEFSFVLAREGLLYSIGTGYYYQLFLAISLITMALTPVLLAIAPKVADIICKIPFPNIIKAGFNNKLLHSHFSIHDNHVIIVGFGVIGCKLAHLLKASKIDYCILETNPETVRLEKKRGQPIYYGDASHKASLRHVDIHRAGAVVVVINDPTAAKRIVKLARQENKNIYIVVRTRFLKEADEYKKLGASYVVVDECESFQCIFTHVLNRYNDNVVMG